jgi:acetyltransferase-like isoleucine patch superfamily enzyme
MIRKGDSESPSRVNSILDCNDVKVDGTAILKNVQIKARRLVIGEKTILNSCKIISSGSVVIGKNTIIKENAVINAFRSVSIGDNTIIDREVVIGGMQSEKSEIKIGNDCVVLFRSYLNVTRKISIEDNVGIGGYCLIFTHGAWQNALAGNPYRFADVTIRRNSWVPWNITIMPGVTIGENVTIGSGSVITKDLPANVFATGIPACIKSRKKINRLTRQQKLSILLEIISDFKGYLTEYLGVKQLYFKISGGEFSIGTKNEKLVYTSTFAKVTEQDILISFKISNEVKMKFQWIELDSLSSNAYSKLADQFVSFVRRYGLKIKNQPT